MFKILNIKIFILNKKAFKVKTSTMVKHIPNIKSNLFYWAKGKEKTRLHGTNYGDVFSLTC